jgi:hypothetical protein
MVRSEVDRMASAEQIAARQAVALERDVKDLESVLKRVTASRKAAAFKPDAATEKRLAKRRRTLARMRKRLAVAMAATTPGALAEARRRDEARRDARRPAPATLRGVMVAPGTAADATGTMPRQARRSGPVPTAVRPPQGPTTRTAAPSRAVADESTAPGPGYVQLLSDPDSASRTVWIFKTGTTFHRRDCRVVENRGNAVQVPVQRAKDRGMTRCMLCCPSVR